MIAAVVVAGLYVWVMDPILHFTQPPGIDLSDKESYLVVDKYEQDPDVQPSVNLTVVFPAYNEVNILSYYNQLSFGDDFGLFSAGISFGKQY